MCIFRAINLPSSHIPSKRCDKWIVLSPLPLPFLILQTIFFSNVTMNLPPFNNSNSNLSCAWTGSTFRCKITGQSSKLKKTAPRSTHQRKNALPSPSPQQRSVHNSKNKSSPMTVDQSRRRGWVSVTVRSRWPIPCSGGVSNSRPVGFALGRAV